MTTVRSVTVKLKADISDFNRRLLEAAGSAKAFASGLDSSNSRMTSLVQTAVALGPALIPVMAGAAVGAGALATSLTFAAAGAGVAVYALNHVGESLTALNKYQMDPTAENLDALHDKLLQLAPAGQDFVFFLDSLQPKLDRLQATAQQEFLPGLQDGITTVMTQLPIVNQLVGNLASTMGDLASEAGAALADPFWTGFLEDFSRNASDALSTMARGIGNVTTGLAGMFQAFLPVGHDFNQELLELSESFSKWGQGLSENRGFQDFVAYVEENGPLVEDALGQIALTFAAIVKAGAPVGHEILPVITLLARGLADIADSPAGPVLFSLAAGLAALARAAALLRALNANVLVSGISKSLGGPEMAAAQLRIRGLAAGIGALGLIASQELPKAAAGLSGLVNVASDAALGFSVGGPWGAAIGGAVGVLTQLGGAAKFAATDVDSLTASLNDQTGAITQNTRELVANTLEQNGTLDAAREAGLNLATVTQAALGNQSAIAQLQAQYAAYAPTVGDAAKTNAGLAIALQEGTVAGYANVQANDSVSQAIKRVLEDVGAEADAVDGSQKAWRNVIDAMGGAKDGSDKLSGAQRHLFDTTQQLTLAQQALGTALSGRLGTVASLTLEIESAQAAMEGLTGATKAGGTRIDITSHAGAVLTQQLVAIANAGSSVTGSAQVQAAAVDRARAAMFALARQARMTRAAAHALVDQLLQPFDVNTSQAQAKLRALQAQIDNMHGNEVRISVVEDHQYTRSGVQVDFNADGGVVDYFAGGGILEQIKAHRTNLLAAAYGAGGLHEDHRAQIAPAGAWRVWAEPETGGEGYVPLAPSKRPQSRPVAEEIVNRLGGRGDRIDWMANGGLIPQHASPTVGGRDAAIVAGLAHVSSRVDRVAQSLTALEVKVKNPGAFAEQAVGAGFFATERSQSFNELMAAMDRV